MTPGALRRTSRQVTRGDAPYGSTAVRAPVTVPSKAQVPAHDPQVEREAHPACGPAGTVDALVEVTEAAQRFPDLVGGGIGRLLQGVGDPAGVGAGRALLDAAQCHFRTGVRGGRWRPGPGGAGERGQGGGRGPRPSRLGRLGRDGGRRLRDARLLDGVEQFHELDELGALRGCAGGHGPAAGAVLPLLLTAPSFAAARGEEHRAQGERHRAAADAGEPSRARGSGTCAGEWPHLGSLGRVRLLGMSTAAQVRRPGVRAAFRRGVAGSGQDRRSRGGLPGPSLRAPTGTVGSRLSKE